MPVLVPNKDSHKLTISEALKRLEKNPNDPELLEFKKSLVGISDIFIPSQKELTRIAESYRSVVESVASSLQGTLFLKATINTQLFDAVREMANTQRKIIEAFRAPSYLFESLRELSLQVNQMYEPIKLLSQSFAVFKTPILFNELSKMDTNWPVPGFVVSEEPKLAGTSAYEEELVNESKIFTSEMEILKEQGLKIVELPYYYYKASKTLFFQVTTVAAIPLYSRSGNSDTEVLVTTLLDFLEERGETVGEFKRVFVPIKELIGKLASKWKKSVNSDWIKNTKSNFMHQKVTELLEDVINISNYDFEKEGYVFQIRVSIPVPKILS